MQVLHPKFWLLLPLCVSLAACASPEDPAPPPPGHEDYAEPDAQFIGTWEVTKCETCPQGVWEPETASYTAPDVPGGPEAALQPLEVHTLNVGQADAVFVRCPHGTHEMLIDSHEMPFKCQPSKGLFRDYMEAVQDPMNPIEFVVASHPHSDHIGGLPWVFARYQVERYADSGFVYSSATWEAVEAGFSTEGALYVSPWDVDSFQDVAWCSLVRCRVLIPDGFGDEFPHHDNNANNISVNVRLDYGSKSFLFTGDTEGELEKLLLEDPDTLPLLDVDFLKVAHHGAENASSVTFLAAVTPEVASISCGKAGEHQHADWYHPRLASVENLLPHLRSEGSGRTVEAWSHDAGWTTVSTDRALFVTMGVKGYVFECDGEGIRLRE